MTSLIPCIQRKFKNFGINLLYIKVKVIKGVSPKVNNYEFFTNFSIYLYAIWVDKQRKKFQFHWKKSKFYIKFFSSVIRNIGIKRNMKVTKAFDINLSSHCYCQNYSNIVFNLTSKCSSDFFTLDTVDTVGTIVLLTFV